MKRTPFPDWVEKYREKGKTVKKLANGYALYSCTSTYVKGGSPKSVQEYLGMITEDEGFIPKSLPINQTVFLEFGLSALIHSCYKRKLQRSVLNSNLDLIMVGIVKFVFGHLSPYAFAHCALTYADSSRLYDYSTKISPRRIQHVINKIELCFEESIPDETERMALLSGLRLVVIEPGHPSSYASCIDPYIRDIMDRHNLEISYE